METQRSEKTNASGKYRSPDQNQIIQRKESVGSTRKIIGPRTSLAKNPSSSSLKVAPTRGQSTSLN